MLCQKTLHFWPILKRPILKRLTLLRQRWILQSRSTHHRRIARQTEGESRRGLKRGNCGDRQHWMVDTNCGFTSPSLDRPSWCDIPCKFCAMLTNTRFDAHEGNASGEARM